MDLALIGPATGTFVVTNIDDLLLLAVFFGRAGQDRAAAARVVAGQFLGFGATVVLAVVGALGAGLLPASAIPYLGVVPLALGLWAGWQVWRGDAAEDDDAGATGSGILTVAAVIFANGGDNIGVYVPVFASSGAGSLVVYVVVFVLLTAVWCALGRFFATRPVIARALARWGHLALPVVLVAIGLVILAEGGVLSF